MRNTIIATLSISSLFLMGCASVVQKPVITGSADSQEQLMGAALIAVATSGYSVESVGPDSIATTRRYHPEDKENNWVLNVTTTDGRLKVDVDSTTDHDGKICKATAWQMEMVGAHTLAELERTPRAKLEKVGKSYREYLAVQIQEKEPGPECENVGIVNASANRRESPLELKNALEGRLRLEALSLGANYIQTSSLGDQEVQSGMAFRCSN